MIVCAVKKNSTVHVRERRLLARRALQGYEGLSLRRGHVSQSRQGNELSEYLGDKGKRVVHVWVVPHTVSQGRSR